MRCFGVAGLMWAAGVAGRAEPAEAVRTVLPETVFPELKTLLDTAVRQSPRMIARGAEDAAAEANRTVARAGQLPTVGGFAQFNPWQRDDRADLRSPVITQKFYYNLNVTQPLYHWGELQNNTRIGELQLQAAQGQTAETYRQLVQEIRSFYLQLVAKKAGLARARFGRDLAANQLKLAEEKLAAKVISGAEVFGVRMNLTQAALALDRQVEEFEVYRRQLAKLSGTDAPTEEQVPEAIPRFTPPLAALEAMLGAGQPPASAALRVLHDQIEVEQLTYKNATTRLRPRVNLVVGLNQDEQSYTSNIAAKYQVQSYYAGTQLNWPIFDGFATRGVIAGSLARLRQLERNYHEQSTAVLEQARSQLRQLGFAARAMAITDQFLAMGENGVAFRKQDMARGESAQADVDTAQAALLDARVNACNNRLDFLLRMAEFLSTLAQDPALANLPGNKP